MWVTGDMSRMANSNLVPAEFGIEACHGLAQLERCALRVRGALVVTMPKGPPMQLRTVLATPVAVAVLVHA